MSIYEHYKKVIKSYIITKEVPPFFPDNLFLNQAGFHSYVREWGKKSNPIILMFRKNQEKSFHTTKHSTLQNPTELFCYLDDKDKMGRFKDKRS